VPIGLASLPLLEGEGVRKVDGDKRLRKFDPICGGEKNADSQQQETEKLKTKKEDGERKNVTDRVAFRL
jgi:hypothetical protein